MRLRNCTSALLLLVVVVVSVCHAQTAKPNSGDPKYDPKSEAKIKGTIEEVKQITVGKDTRLSFEMKSGEELIEVGLCPPDVLKELGVEFAKGDEVEITGSKVKKDDKDLVLAREIVKGDNTVVLRDKNGAPVWTWMRK